MKKLLRILSLLVIIFLSGCSFSQSTWHKAAVPVNAGIAYFASVGLHELGHKGALNGFGAPATVHMTPRRHNGRTQIALTSFNPDGLTKSQLDASKAAGPYTNFIASVTFRGALRTGLVPTWLQPTLAWADVANRGLSYYHALAGLARVDGVDLGKVPIWIPATFLIINVAYDIGTFLLSKDTMKRYFGVLIGEEYYDAPN